MKDRKFYYHVGEVGITTLGDTKYTLLTNTRVVSIIVTFQLAQVFD